MQWTLGKDRELRPGCLGQFQAERGSNQQPEQQKIGYAALCTTFFNGIKWFPTSDPSNIKAAEIL